MSERPKVSLGMPVYNGENFIVEALESLLGQTYQDFEIIICDNASNDKTEAICREYAARDGRIRYTRNETNIGASANYNKCFELGRGEYFKWAAHDDLCAPTFLERCVEALERDADVVLAYTRAKAIDNNSNIVKVYPGKKHYNSPEARVRFYEFVVDPHPVVAVFGVMRRDALSQTRLIGNYVGADRPLLSEMSLLGKFFEVPEFLFFYRFHEQQSWGGGKTKKAQQAWYDPRRAGKRTFPQWRLLREHMRSIERSPLGLRDRLSCYVYMVYWMRRYWRPLRNNLLARDV